MPTYNGARAQRDLMDRAAIIQKQRDEQLSGYQAQAAQAQTQQQRQVLGDQAGYQAQAMQQQAGIQQNRDLQQFQYGYAGNEQQANIQRQRDQLLIQNQQERDAAQRQQEAAMHEAGVQGQMRVLNNQLSQGETLRLQRLRQQLGAVDEAVHNGTLSQNDGNQVRMQLQSGIDPLQRRLVQSNIDNEQARTQGLQQQTTQQATEFNRRQAILAQTAQQRMHMVQDTTTGTWHQMQMGVDGTLVPLDLGASHMERMSRVYQAQSNIQTQEQNRTQSAQSFPLQMQAMLQNIQHLAQMQPWQVAAIRQQVEQGAEAFPNAQEYEQARTALAHFDLYRQQRMLPGQLEGQTNANTLSRLQGTSLSQNISQNGQLFAPHLRTALAGATQAEQQSLITTANAAVAPQLAQLRLALERGHVTQAEYDIRHRQLVNTALETSLQGSLTPQERRTHETEAWTAVRQQLASYQAEVNRRERMTPTERERAGPVNPPAWLRREGDDAFTQLMNSAQPNLSPAEIQAAMERAVSAHVTARAADRRRETGGGMTLPPANPPLIQQPPNPFTQPGAGAQPGQQNGGQQPGGGAWQAGDPFGGGGPPTQQSPAAAPIVGGGVDGARAAVGLPPATAAGGHAERPANSWRNLSPQQIHDALTPAQRRQWHEGLTPFHSAFWTPSAHSAEIERRRDEIWAARGR